MDRRCCCVKECLVGSDDFERPDVNPVDGDWYVATGSPQIVSGRLRLATDDCVVYQKRTGQPSGVLMFEMHGFNVGQKLTVICGCDQFGVGGIEVSWELTTNQQTLTIPGETNSFVDYSIPHGEAEMRACWSGAGRQVSITDADGSTGLTECSDGPDDRYFAFRCDNGTVEINECSYWRHYRELVGCPSCDCSCEGECLEETLNLTIVAVNGACSALDGVTIPITEIQPIGVKVASTWAATYDCGSGNELYFEFQCNAGGATSGFTLYHPNSTFYRDDYLLYSEPVAELSTCDPLDLVFGPFYIHLTSSEDPDIGYQDNCCNYEAWPATGPRPSIYLHITQ